MVVTEAVEPTTVTLTMPWRAPDCRITSATAADCLARAVCPAPGSDSR
jgi:hypothetical protein